MSIRAQAEHDFARDAFALRVANVRGPGEVDTALEVHHGSLVYGPAPPGTVTDPVLSFTTDEAHAIYDALGVALNRAHPHADQGRADLLHERGRVDRLIDTVSRIADSREDR